MEIFKLSLVKIFNTLALNNLNILLLALIFNTPLFSINLNINKNTFKFFKFLDIKTVTLSYLETV